MNIWKAHLSTLLGGILVWCAQAEAVVSLEGSPRSVPAFFLGYNGNLARGGNWNDVSLRAAFCQLHPGHLRYPAGTLANYWDWRTGWFKDVIKAPYGLGKVEPNPYRLEDLKRACDAAGVEPLIVLNLLTSTLDEQMEMLRQAQKLGLSVRRVELGNEFYLDPKDYVSRFPAAEEYGREANHWIAAIKQEFPHLQVGVVGAAVRPGDDVRRRTWNERLLPVLNGADAIVLHVYQGTGLGDKSSAKLEAAGLEVRANGRKGGPRDWSEQRALKLKFHTADGIARVLGMPFQRWTNLTELGQIPRGMQVWITEYNLFDRTGPVRGTWAHGLVAAAQTLNFLQDERIRVATYHALYGNPMFSAILHSENAFAGLVENPPPTTPYALTASGRALALLGEALAGGGSAQKLAFPDNPKTVVPRLNPYPSLVGWKFTQGSTVKCFILNLSTNTVTLPPGGAMPATGRYEQISGDPHALVTGPDSLTVRTGEFSRETEVAFAPYSCTLIQATTRRPPSVTPP